MRTGYDMDNHDVAAGSHAQSLKADFIHRFGIAGPLEEAISRFLEIRDCGLNFVRVIPGARDMPRDVAATSIQALSKVVAAVADTA